ncbi:TlpA family protein disulfide reductase [Sphingobacterium sp. SGL-16]|uniref:TlpA family protein disulfide reductase n=1 Tax=Sphingobacterium sp. SGL-16 TaxID=2710883 RepID=UPI0013EABBEA|nr:TlpA disulfide reductase family protein [Sphingobacterium sp. SGL-16]NGM72830.1 TlpA family protein disulfide reductase [Sphingobacterium sp. SGL-16]
MLSVLLKIPIFHVLLVNIEQILLFIKSKCDSDKLVNKKEIEAYTKYLASLIYEHQLRLKYESGQYKEALDSEKKSKYFKIIATVLVIYLLKIVITVPRVYNKFTFKPCTLFLLLTLFITNIQGQVVENKEVIFGGKKLDEEKFKNVDLTFDVSYHYHFEPENYKHTLKIYPWADLVRYPLISYNLNYEKTPNVRIGDSIPFIVGSLPFQYVDAKGVVNIGTLSDFSNNKLLILDFWATWCAPCVKSMDKWNEIVKELPQEVAVIGVMLDFDYKAQQFGVQRNWHSPIMFGPQAYIFNSFFFSQQTVSRIAWVKDGKLITITGTQGYDIQLIKDFLSGNKVNLPTELDWTYSVHTN